MNLISCNEEITYTPDPNGGYAPFITAQSFVVKKGALIAVTALLLLLSTVISLFMIAFMIMLVVDYFVFPRFNLEFEYTYFTGSLDIDKIMNMQARKRVISTDVKDIM